MQRQNLDQNALYEKLRGQIRKLYGDSENIIEVVLQEIAATKQQYHDFRAELSEKNVYLIAYADQLQDGKESLKLLKDFVAKHLSEAFSCVHLLPFYPSSSDGGFAVKDYREVCKDYGTWQDIAAFKEAGVSVMLDAVFNHASSEHEWFRKWRSGDESFAKYFYAFDHIDEDLKKDLEKVTRPRAHPLMTRFDTKNGERWVWTTFSEDQVDLNISDPEVFLELVKIYLFYLLQNTSAVRMDAVPFLWKKLGTSCSHLPETHLFLQIFKTITDCIDPNIQMIAEANVPQEENLTYLGENGQREADLIYNFTYPPLICHAILNNETKYFKNWLKDLAKLEHKGRFFNVSATHDGIGVRSLEGVVPALDIDHLSKIAVMKGGHVSHKTMPNGLQALYELNITWASLLYQKQATEEQNVRLLVNSHALSWALPGVPAVYFHNLFATFNDQETFEKTKHRRDLNRKRYHFEELERHVQKGLHKEVFTSMLHILQVRRSLAAFHPHADLEVLDLGQDIIAFRRFLGEKKVNVIFNNSAWTIPINLHPLGTFDHIKNRELEVEYQLAPYEMLWLS